MYAFCIVICNVNCIVLGTLPWIRRAFDGLLAILPPCVGVMGYTLPCWLLRTSCRRNAQHPPLLPLPAHTTHIHCSHPLPHAHSHPHSLIDIHMHIHIHIHMPAPAKFLFSFFFLRFSLFLLICDNYLTLAVSRCSNYNASWVRIPTLSVCKNTHFISRLLIDTLDPPSFSPQSSIPFIIYLNLLLLLLLLL